ncbi:hypothetical protein [Mycobacterium shigaense]|uniref:hypothetical protein n=1 Tax=Mycobacterium shigaense TaxID=722731 RepID=UPI002ADF8294|nr:hypothetical protein [Mycobacterium shigaense]MEA1121710.1 hypothetical protein [Mycobacterium shigaense]
MNTTDAIPLRPEMISFSPIKIDGQHVLRMVIHTENLGTFVMPSTPAQAAALATTLLDYVDQVCEYEAAEHTV